MIDKALIVSLLPEIVIILGATLIYLAGTFVVSARTLLGLSVGTLLAAMLLWFLGDPPQQNAYGSPLLSDALSSGFRGLSLVFGLLLLLTASWRGDERLGAEFQGTILMSIAGVMLVASAGELVLMFMALELISVPTYVLLFLGRKSDGSREATIKYFFLSILSSAFFLYGLTFLYGLAGSTLLADIAERFTTDDLTPLAPLALILVFGGLSFKIAAVPFQFYAPDVYQGTTNGVAGLLSVLPKIAGVIALIRLVVVSMPVLAQFGWQLAMTVAILTMTIGNVSALWQNNVRRLLAYSSIAHAGYMLIGLAAALAAADMDGTFGVNGLMGLLFYLIVYSVATIGAFAALASVNTGSGEIDRVDQLAGLGKNRPLIAACLAVAMFSLMGIPPLAGFWGKFTLFTASLEVIGNNRENMAATWFMVLVVVGILNAAIAAAYYLRIVAVMFFQSSNKPHQITAVGPVVATVACAMLAVALGISPRPVIEYTRSMVDNDALRLDGSAIASQFDSQHKPARLARQLDQ